MTHRMQQSGLNQAHLQLPAGIAATSRSMAPPIATALQVIATRAVTKHAVVTPHVAVAAMASVTGRGVVAGTTAWMAAATGIVARRGEAQSTRRHPHAVATIVHRGRQSAQTCAAAGIAIGGTARLCRHMTAIATGMGRTPRVVSCGACQRTGAARAAASAMHATPMAAVAQRRGSSMAAAVVTGAEPMIRTAAGIATVADPRKGRGVGRGRRVHRRTSSWRSMRPC